MGPYLFTKIQRALVGHWRSKGFGIFVYLDDGAGADQVLNKAIKMSTVLQVVSLPMKRKASGSPHNWENFWVL